MWGKNQHQQQVPAAPHKGTNLQTFQKRLESLFRRCPYNGMFKLWTEEKGL